MIYIYALIDPKTGSVRYVGKTSNLRRRLNAHIARSKLGCKYHAPQWIASLVADGIRPVMDVLEEMPDDADWASREIHWIEFYKRLGCDLTNTAPGGLGYASYGRLGKKNTEEHKRKCSESRKGISIKQRDPLGRRAAALRAIAREKQLSAEESGIPNSWGKHTEEHKEHMRTLGKSPAFMANMLKAAAASAEKRRGRPGPNRGIKLPPETVEKISAAKKGVPWSEARREAQRKRKEEKLKGD